MLNPTVLLFYIFMLLALGAVIAFSYTVIKPMQTRWAVAQGRKIVTTSTIGSRWRFENTYRMLSTARNDMEAAELWRKLQEIRESAKNQP